MACAGRRGSAVHSTARVGRPPMAPRVWHQGSALFLRRLQAARAEGRACACAAAAGRRTAGRATRHRRRPLRDGRRKRMPRKRRRRRGPRRGALRSCSARACLRRRQQRWALPPASAAGLFTDVWSRRAWRKQIEEEERKMDPDLRDSTQNIIDWVKCRLHLKSLPCF